MSKVRIIDRHSEKSIKGEREFLSILLHPFIVNMVCSFQDYDNLYLVMDLLTGGDLRYHICKQRKFPESQTKFFIACIILGLEYCHRNKIIHRDIKPENLVLDSNGYVHITDFGIAKIQQNHNSKETSGTPGYMSPEVMCGQDHTILVDYFAIGVMGYEFMKGYRPYLGKSRKEIKEKMISHQAHVKKMNCMIGVKKVVILLIDYL
jgi:serine/threonine protein kinase